MIREIQIKNFKSIDDLTLELGRVNVLIGANGCGKTNILEAICLGGAAVADKLDNEYLAPRGIRYATPREMRSGFQLETLNKPVELKFINSNSNIFEPILTHSNETRQNWTVSLKYTQDDQIRFTPAKIKLALQSISNIDHSEIAAERILTSIVFLRAAVEFFQLSNFLIYSPDHTSIRRLEDEERTLPLGIDGCGLFRLLQELSLEKIEEVKTHLRMIDWFDDFEMPDNLIPGERRLRIKDQYIAEGLQFFEQRVANEGFLFLLFYLCLFISEHTPKFFAIDNLDNGFNPKLCTYTAKTLCELAKTHDKQAIITTHNPSVLDGLDLKDDENRLFVVYRNIEGRTRIRRILPKDQPQDEPPLRLSEAFLRGYLGGLPRNF
ncbi:MAG: AAA family ATPase [Myxococcales bacterium]|jgi:AAA15 family ATPase/GTPase|nr:AAA family ATPase [Myxococcales bacterium]